MSSGTNLHKAALPHLLESDLAREMTMDFSFPIWAWILVAPMVLFSALSMMK
jgi:hypothetical protein